MKTKQPTFFAKQWVICRMRKFLRVRNWIIRHIRHNSFNSYSEFLICSFFFYYNALMRTFNLLHVFTNKLQSLITYDISETYIVLMKFTVTTINSKYYGRCQPIAEMNSSWIYNLRFHALQIYDINRPCCNVCAQGYSHTIYTPR